MMTEPAAPSTSNRPEVLAAQPAFPKEKRKMNRRYAVIVSLCLLAVMASACTGAGTPAAAEPSVVRIGWAGSPDTLNPGTALLVEAYTVFDLVYSSMVSLDLDGSTYRPELAESWDVSDDGLTWTFHLRPGATWHDGEPVTASDVAFTYNFYGAHEDFPYMPGYTTYFDSVEAVDDQTVAIHLTEPIPNMESQLFYMFILPEHIWSQYEGQAAVEFENAEMIGSGPFRLVEYRPNEFVHLAAVQDHYLTPPVVDEVVFQTFESQDALVQALRTGQVDMITEMPQTAVESLSQEANVEVVHAPDFHPDIADIIFNQVAPEDCPPDDGVCSGHPALQDRTVRVALAHATDKQTLIDVVLLGLGDPGMTLVPNALGKYYNSELPDFAFDPAEANRLLDEAGYLDTDGDGVRQMPGGGDPIVLRMNWPGDSITAPREAELLSQMWGEIGVDTELQVVDADTLGSLCCPTFDFDVILWGWGSDPDPSALLGVMTSDEITSGYSETGYNNPEYDALYAQQATELDAQTRQDIIWRMQEIVHNDVVYIVPWYAQAVQAYRSDRFQGWLTDQPLLALQDVSSLVVVQPVP
jgi:peptide/nickel transport system substrate-binding protein